MAKGKSQAQEAIAQIARDAFPFAYVSEETHIKVLIERQGYTIDEIARELGHKPHRMFVDITIRDSDGTYCIEYDGEQHFRQIGNMTATSSALNLNKELDREKSWILSRIGIPLVRIPYDAYVDVPVLTDMIDKASIECEECQRGYYVCERCGRRFPSSVLTDGKCGRCLDELADEEAAAAEEEEREDCRVPDERDDDSAAEYKRQMKEIAKKRRKEARERYKNSPEYKQMKEEAKRRRKEAYREMKRRKSEQDDE